jgi:hypothetical protein
LTLSHSRIPQRIIQTGKDLNLSLLARASVANLRLLNPEFEYLFFDNEQVEEFIRTRFPQYRDVFYSFPKPIQRYDFFRYLAVYHLGGFYFDLDVFLASGLEDLLHFGCVFPFEELSIHPFLRQEYGMDWEIGNYAFGAEAGHPFLEAIIRNCVRAQADPVWASAMTRTIPRLFREEFLVLDTTGPGLVSRTLAEYPDAADQVAVLFPEDVCDAGSWHCFGQYGVHLQQDSWRKRNNFLRRRLAILWRSSMRRTLRKESLKLGKARSLHFKNAR